MRRKGGFTAVELTVTLAALALAGVALAAAVSGTTLKSRFSACATNLKTLGRQLAVYDANCEMTFPAIRDVMKMPTTAQQVTQGVPTPKTLAAGRQEIEALQGGPGMPLFLPMQEVWPLMEAGMPPTIFHCPNDAGYVARPDYKKPDGTPLPLGWGSPHEYSYGVQWPYLGLADDNGLTTMRNLAPPYGKRMMEQLVVFADQNPGGPVDPEKRLHSNHPEAGCNALQRSGTVTSFSGKRMNGYNSKAGLHGDDIYVDWGFGRDGARAVDSVPDDICDTVIVPFVAGKPGPPPAGAVVTSQPARRPDSRPAR